MLALLLIIRAYFEDRTLHKPNANDLESLKILFEAGKIVPEIDKCFPLSEVDRALKYFGEGRAKGKIVITMK